MSSSVILSKQLEMESAELKEHISKFFDEKARDFAWSMKVKIDGFVDQKLSNYYHQEDSTPFKEFDIKISANGWGTNYHLRFSMNTYVIMSRHVGSNQDSPTHTIKHNLTRPMLDTLKELFGKFVQIDSSDIVLSIIQKMIDNPKYFMTNSTEFETTCKKEYAFIKSKKKELNELLEEQKQKKEYYIELESKKKDIEIERKKLSEERAYLLEVKRKLFIMKEEVEKEKAQIKSVNLNDFN
jgi:hypothetical protein